MLSLTISIDPGLSGAIAYFSGTDLVSVEDMPTADKRVAGSVLAHDIAEVIEELGVHPLREVFAVVEKAQSMPRQGVASSFNYGVGYGVILGVLDALLIPRHLVAPGVWKKAMGLTASKDLSRAKALDLWPGHSDRFKLKKHDGRAEAALLGRYYMDHVAR